MFEIGNSLREARIKRGVDFHELEAATKIRAKHLRALEDERFEVLPSQTYVKGFLRAYAEALGLDGQPFVDEFNTRFATGMPVERETRPRRSTVRPKRERRLERNAVLIAVVGIAAVTALVIAAWRFGGGGGNPEQAQKPAGTSPATKQAPQRASIVIRAIGGESLVIVRRDSATGLVLHNGVVRKNHPKHFVGRRFWLNLGTPTNLELVLNGRPYAVGGDRPCVLVVTPDTIRPAASGSC